MNNDLIWANLLRLFTHLTVEQKQVIYHKRDEYVKQRLAEYTTFLLEEGYCDTDVYNEPPTAIDRFLNPKLR